MDSWVTILIAGSLVLFIAPGATTQDSDGFTLETDGFRWEVGANGANAAFIDKVSGKDFCDKASAPSFAHVAKGGQVVHVAAASEQDGYLALEFGDAGVRAVIRAESKGAYMTLEVVAVEGEGADSLTLGQVALAPRPDETFTVCALA
ncbi:MAG TPA: hypothetical protein ENN80_07735, partial [Candidatus Hydrogenedentes bacterium]|nr:hypothetical protein [Candidatus Hydrogenedentota bacterium]